MDLDVDGWMRQLMLSEKMLKMMVDFYEVLFEPLEVFIQF